MPFINDHIVLQELDEARWTLLEPLTYQGRQESFTVPAGFITDLASVPRIFTWLIPNYGKYTKAAVLHDYLCATKVINRSDADGLFRRTMRELGVPFLQRWVMWAAVRTKPFLEAAGFVETIQWLLVGIPALVFVIIPALVVWVFLFLFELIAYVILMLSRAAADTLKLPGQRKRVNPPRFRP